MIYRFDYFNRYEEPQLVLCQPSDREIGIINNPIDLKLEINFNDISTLSYRIYNNDEELTEVGEAGGVEKKWIPSESKPNVYRMHKERRQVHALGVGYFIIDSVIEVEDSTGIYKDITCKSCESELNNIVAPGVALKEVNMYPLYNTVYPDKISNYERFKYLDDITTAEVSDDDTGVYISESCILFNILCYAPAWRLSDECVLRFESDPKYMELAGTLRNFNDEDSTVYSFLRDKIASAYECVVLFDIENRTIDIKTYDDVFAQSTMILAESNILDKCEVKTDIDDYVNSLTVEGGSDNLFVSDFTPDGTNVVYNFSHDLATGMIDGELAEALKYWETAASNLNRVTIEGATGLPLRVYPDFYEGYSGNDLYQFLLASRKALKEWFEGYQKAKADNIAYSEISPPDITVHIAGQTDWVNAEKGRYKFTVKKAFSSTDIINFGWDTLYSNIDNSLKTIIPCSGGASTPEAQAQTIKTQIQALGTTLPFTVEYTNGNDFFVIEQKRSGVGIPYVEVTNTEHNISGTLSFEMENPGYAASSTTYTSFETSTVYDGGTAKIVTKGCGWIEAYREDDVEWELPEANKVLIYLQQEKEDANGCYISASSYKDSLDKEIEALEEEAKMSTYDFNTSASENEDPEIAIYREQISFATKYRDLFIKFATAYLRISEQLDSWIGTLKDKIYEATEARKFQGAFKNYYMDVKGVADTDEAQAKAVILYNQLTRVLRMQSFKDDSIISTDEMKMQELFEQEEALYNKAVNTLTKLVQPNADITIDAEPFIFNEEYNDVTKNLDMGHCIYIELPNGEVPMYHLNKINIDYGAPSCQLTFGDRIRSSDPADIFGELQKTASTAANIVASERIDWGVKTSAINLLMKEKDADIATTFRAMSNSINNVRIDNEGLNCFSVNPLTGAEEYGFRGANGTLMFIEKDGNGNQTPKMAIGRIYHSDGSVEYGLYGDRILANTITADKLAVGAVGAGSNYIKNGSFEGSTGTTTGNGNISNWYSNVSNYTGVLPVSTYRTNGENPINGEYCLKIPIGGVSATTSSVLSPDRYTLSYYYKFKSVGDILYVKVKKAYTDTSGQLTSTHTGNSDNINKWQKGIIEVEVGETGTRAVIFSTDTENSSSGIYVDAVMLAKGYNTEYSPHISETYAKYTAIDQNGIRIYDGNFTIYDSSGERKIWTEVNDSASLFNVKGRINAEYLTATAGGEFSGWKFDNTTLWKDEKINSVDCHKYGMSTKADRPAIWVGYTRNGNYPANGKNGFYGGDNNDNINSHGARFLVTQEGYLYADNAYIKGNIIATSLELTDNSNIGGWKVTGDGLKSTSYNLLLKGNPTNDDDLVIKAGTDNTTYFKVTADGRVTCNSLSAGDITITKNGTSINEGTKIGGSWTIGTHTLHTTINGSDSSDCVLDAGGKLIITPDGDLFARGRFMSGWNTGDSAAIIQGDQMLFSTSMNRIDGFQISGGIGTYDAYGMAISCAKKLTFGNRTTSLSTGVFTDKIVFDLESNNAIIKPYSSVYTNELGSSDCRWKNLYVDNINCSGNITGSFSVPWNNISSKPTFATVATSGNYNDLTSKPLSLSNGVYNLAGSLNVGSFGVSAKYFFLDTYRYLHIDSNNYLRYYGGNYDYYVVLTTNADNIVQ